MKCFGGGFRRDSLEDELAWLKGKLERETQQRQAAQLQLAQEQAKCVLLEQEIQHAAQAAHEMGESLRQFFSQSGSEGSDLRPWGSSTGTRTPESMLQTQPSSKQHAGHSTTSGQNDTSSHDDQGRPPNSASTTRSFSRMHPDQQHQHMRKQQHQHHHQHEHQAPHSSCSSFRSSLQQQQQRPPSVPGCATDCSPLLSRQPRTGRGTTARMHRHVLEVADQLKGLAISWQQRLDEYQPLHAAAAGASTPDLATAARKSAAAAGARTSSVGAAAAANCSSLAMQQQQQQGCSSADASLHEDGMLPQPQPAGCLRSSEEWGSHSSSFYTDTPSNGTAALTHDTNELSSSGGSFVRYRSSMQHSTAVEDIEEEEEEEGEEEEEEEESEQESEQVSEEEGTDDEAVQGGADEQWQSHSEQQQLQQLRARFNQQKQQQQLQQQQQQPGFSQQHQPQGGSWGNRPDSGAVVPGCAITRGAAPQKSPPPPNVAANNHLATTAVAGGGARASPAGAAVAAAPAAAMLAAGHSPLAAGAAAISSRVPGQAIHQHQKAAMPAQQQQQQYEPYQQQQQQQRQEEQYRPAAYIQQPQQQPRRVLSPVNRQASWRPGYQGQAIDSIPRDLKCMAPLRRHQQYLGTNQNSYMTSMAPTNDLE